MSELHPSLTSASTAPAESTSSARLVGSARALLYLALTAAVGMTLYAQFQSVKATNLLERSQNALIDNLGVTAPMHKHLATGYSDKEGRLLADPPADPAKLLDPGTLVVGYGEDSDLDVQPIAWDEFKSYLADVTGKNVEIEIYQNTPDEVATVKDGKMQIVALHAADTPYLVNNAGFVPVAVVGAAGAAEGNRLDVAVPANSKIHCLADIRNHTLTCTTPVSITGHRAAVAVLLQDANLRPDIDYTINFSLGQKKSVLGLASGEFEVAALSDDKLQSLLKSGRIKESDLQIIYQSQVIPRFTIGYVYNLQPELAAKVTQAIMGFKNEGGPIDEDTHVPMHFVAVDYKKDFEFVRKIDESFDPRLGPKPPKSKPATESDASPPEA
jgi:phosphonate transport system substrate-binding protein